MYEHIMSEKMILIGSGELSCIGLNNFEKCLYSNNLI